MRFVYDADTVFDENYNSLKEEKKREQDVQKKSSEIFSAESFVDNLLENGSKVACDKTIEEFTTEGIPEFYDAIKFKRGQKFYRDHSFSLLLCKFLGLILTLSSPSILAMLKMTKKSGSRMTAYRRYVATLLHIHLWYRSDLSPNSRSMKSMRRVKAVHNFVSCKSQSMKRSQITQKDMVLTQFGFMGFCIARSETVGIHGTTKEELEGFIHFWRTIGRIMGIQDRFNICRDSLEETREICEQLINRVFRPFVARKDQDFMEMTSYLVNGLWYTDPLLNYRVFHTYLYDILQPKEVCNNNIGKGTKFFELNFIERSFYRLMLFGMCYLIKYDVVRLLLNLKHEIFMWMLPRFPVLAVFAFGYKNAIVSFDDHR